MEKKHIVSFLRYLLLTIVVMGLITLVLYWALYGSITHHLSDLLLPPKLDADGSAAPGIQDIGSWYQGIVGAVLSLASAAVGIAIALVAYVLAANASEREKQANVRENSEFVANLLSNALSPVHEVLQKHKAFMNSVQDFVQPLAAKIRAAEKINEDNPVELAALKSYVLSRFIAVHKGISELRMAIDSFIASGHPLSHQLMAAWFDELSNKAENKKSSDTGAIRYFEVFESPISLDVARCVLSQIERRLTEFGQAADRAVAAEKAAREKLHAILCDGAIGIEAYRGIIESTEAATAELLKGGLFNHYITLAASDGLNDPSLLPRNGFLMAEAGKIVQAEIPAGPADGGQQLTLAVAELLISGYRLRAIENSVFRIVREAIDQKPIGRLSSTHLAEIASKLVFFFGQSGAMVNTISHWPGYSFNLDSVFALKILNIIEEMMPDNDVVFAQIEKSYKLKAGEDFNLMAIAESKAAGKGARSNPCLSLDVTRV